VNSFGIINIVNTYPFQPALPTKYLFLTRGFPLDPFFAISQQGYSGDDVEHWVKLHNSFNQKTKEAALFRTASKIKIVFG